MLGDRLRQQRLRHRSFKEDAAADSSVDAAASGPASRDLVRSVVTTVFSNGNDALNLLFEAGSSGQGATTKASGSGTPTLHPGPHIPSARPPFDAAAMWQRSRFVKMVWMSAPDIVAYLD